MLLLWRCGVSNKALVTLSECQVLVAAGMACCEHVARHVVQMAAKSY
jgi:hypothetical protein